MTAQGQHLRAQFEAWAKTHRALQSYDFALMAGHNEYEEWHLQIAFETWQAARALPAGMEPVAFASGDWVRAITETELALIPDPARRQRCRDMYRHELHTAAQVQTMLAQGLAPAAQEHKPLTDERIREIDDETHFHEAPDWPVRFARAIEAEIRKKAAP